jgi:signal transduction histidine kinase
LPPESCTPDARAHPLGLVPGRPRHTLATALQLEVEQRRQDVVQPGSPFCLALMLAPGSEEVHLPDDVAHAAFWVASEALNNALRSGHHSDLVVHLHAYNHGLRLEVHDSGTRLLGKSTTCQFEPGWPRDLGQHVSLQAMRDRSATIGARLTVRSDPYSGTRIILRWLP